MAERLQGENNGESISFSIWMQGLTPGKRLAFSESKGADIIIDHKIGIYGGEKGEVVITKIDDRIMEGTFVFTASNNKQKK
jgi:hypothetical protein